MKLNDKKILVTGADGFIGSHLTEELVRRGCDVKAFVCYNSFNSWGWLDRSDPSILQSLEVCSGDIRDPRGLSDAIRGADVVFHLAALIAIPYSYRYPDAYVDTNVRGTLNVLQACREHKVERVVHTSTSEVYGTAKFVPITEEHPLQGQSPYAASKIGADYLALSFYSSFDLPVSVARPFNTYGPRQSARAVIPTIISQLISGKRRLSLGALSPTRDFNYVLDTVRGMIAIAESEQALGEVVNIGSNYEVSIRRVAEVIGTIFGETIEFDIDSDRLRPEKSEVERLLADNTKLIKSTPWRPEFGGIEGLTRGLQSTIEWFGHEDNASMYKSSTYNI